MNRLKRSWLLCLLVFASFAESGRAQDFPSRRIQIIVPYAAGGVTDQITRIVSESASNILGQPIIVENRGGAGGQIAANAVKNAEPDGYTLMLADIGTHAINQSIYRTLNYEPFADFQAITLIGESPQVLMVPASSPLKSINDIVDAAEKSPNTIYYASPGVGSGSHLLGEMLRSSKNIAITHVPYKGSSAICWAAELAYILARRRALIHSSRMAQCALLRQRICTEFHNCRMCRQLQNLAHQTSC
jgi:tripartite-type tricarboxylate transporter receptor subunit TctC